VLIDGGKGQVNAVKGVLEELGVEDVPSSASPRGRTAMPGRETFHLMDGREFTLPTNAPVLFYLQRLRDEAHRFAIGAHRQKRAKAIGAAARRGARASALRAKGAADALRHRAGGAQRLAGGSARRRASRWRRASMTSSTADAELARPHPRHHLLGAGAWRAWCDRARDDGG
jgi:hypothetical protein